MNKDLVLVEQSLDEFDAVEAGLQALEASYQGVLYDVATAKGMAEAIEARATVRKPRVQVEKLRKEGKAPILALGRLLDDKARQITARLEALEEPIHYQIKTEEARTEAEKAEKARIEAERVAKIQDEIASIRTFHLRLSSLGSEELKQAYNTQAKTELIGFGEFHALAFKAKGELLESILQMIGEAQLREAKQAAEAAAKKVEEERLAAERKALAEAQAALKKQQEEQAAIEAAARKEREAKEEELRKAQEAAQAAIRKQQEEQEAKDAELRKAQEAAQAEIEREKEALRKEREAIEASKAAGVTYASTTPIVRYCDSIEGGGILANPIESDQAATPIRDMPTITHGADSSAALPRSIEVVGDLDSIPVAPLDRIIRYAKALVNNADLREALAANLEIGWAYTDFVELTEALAEYEESHE